MELGGRDHVRMGIRSGQVVREQLYRHQPGLEVQENLRCIGVIALASFGGGYHLVQRGASSKWRTVRAATLDNDRGSAKLDDAPKFGDFVQEVKILARRSTRKAANHCISRWVDRNGASQRVERIGGTRIGQAKYVITEE